MNTMEMEIRELVCDLLEIPDIKNITDTEDLQKWGMDSLNCIELVIKIEEQFDIEIADEQLGLQYVDSINKIVELVTNYVE